MLEIGRRRAERLGRRVDLRLGGAQTLELPDESLGTVVWTLGLCTIPDPRRAVAEARRVLRPAGRMLLEHVRSPVRAVGVVQRLLEPLSVRPAAVHLTRERSTTCEPRGSRSSVERSKWGSSWPASPGRPS